MAASLAYMLTFARGQQKAWFRRSELALFFDLAQARTHQTVTQLVSVGQVMVRPTPSGAGWEVHRDSVLVIYEAMVEARAVTVKRPW